MIDPLTALQEAIEATLAAGYRPPRDALGITLEATAGEDDG